jgi:hypothetical protein
MMKRGSSLSRRRFLGTAAAVGTTGLAGCGASSQEPEFRIVSLAFYNNHDEAHTFEATITESDEVVFEERIELGPAEYENGGYTIDPETHELSGYPTERGSYVLEATIDDGDSPIEFAPGWSEFAESTECAVLEVRMERDGSPAIWYSTTCEP